MRRKVIRAAPLEPHRVALEKREAQRAHRRARDLLLDRENVFEQPVEGLRPEQRAIGADELRRDPHALARLAHAAVEDGAHLQQPRDLAVVYGAVLELKGSGARCHTQPVHTGERIDDLLGGALAEIALVPARAHVGESEHRDGSVGRRRREGGRRRRARSIGIRVGHRRRDVRVRAFARAEPPRHRERDEKARDHQHDDEPQRPVGQTERHEHRRDHLDEQPASRRVRERDARYTARPKRPPANPVSRIGLSHGTHYRRRPRRGATSCVRPYSPS